LAILGAVLAANFLYLVGLFDPNPVHQLAGLSSTVSPGLLPGSNTIDPNIGYTGQALGHLAALDWLHGTVPWWNPYEGLGAPLAGEMQSAALFPLTLLQGFSSGQTLIRVILEVTAGVSTYFLLRRLVSSRVAATAGAIAFALNGTFSWLFDQTGNPVAFAPLLILGIEQARRPGRIRALSGWPLIAIALALSIYAGFPEVAFIDCVFAALWAVVRGTDLRAGDLMAFGRRLFAGVAAGLLLAAPILVAFVTFLPQAGLGSHSRIDRLSLDPATSLPAKILPYVFGPIFGWSSPAHGDSTRLASFWGNAGGYFGTALFVLALVGLMGSRLRKLRVMLAVWVLLGVLRAVGVNWAAHIVNLIPGISSTWFTRYALASWSLALTVLAVLGMDELIQSRIRWRLVAAGGLAVVAVVLAGHESGRVLTGVRGAPDKQLWASASIAWGASIALACVVAAVVLRDPKLRGCVVGGLLVLDCLALFVVPQFSAPRRVSMDLGPVRFLQAHLGTSRFVTLGPIQPDYGSYWGLSSVNVNDIPVPKTYESYVNKQLDDNVDPLTFVGYKSRDPAGPGPAQEFVSHLAGYESAAVKYLVLQTDNPLPALPLGTRLPVVYQDRLITIRQLPHADPLFGTVGGNCIVRSSSMASASIDCTGQGLLIRRELYLRGWVATNNGSRRPVRSFGGTFQAIALQPGHNNVAFSFAPPYATWAILGSMFGFALIVLEALRRSSRDRRGPIRRESDLAINTEARGVTQSPEPERAQNRLN
jgi:hypothetical protein